MKKTLMLVTGLLLCAVMAFAQGVPLKGEMIAENDASNSGNSTIIMTPGTRDGSASWQFTGSVNNKYQWAYVLWEIEPDTASLANLKAATSISFKILGDGKTYTARIVSSAVKDFAYHEFQVKTKAGQIEEIKIPITNFKQASWGKAVRLRPEDMTAVQFANSNLGAYDVSMWDLKTIK